MLNREESVALYRMQEQLNQMAEDVEEMARFNAELYAKLPRWFKMFFVTESPVLLRYPRLDDNYDATPERKSGEWDTEGRTVNRGRYFSKNGSETDRVREFLEGESA